MNFKYISDYNYAWSWSGSESSRYEGAVIRKPLDPHFAKQAVKQLIAIEIDFGKKAFSKLEDQKKFLEDIFLYTENLEFLDIKGYKEETLPSFEKVQSTLKYLKFNAQNVSNFGNVFNVCSNLEELAIHTKNAKLALNSSEKSTWDKIKTNFSFGANSQPLANLSKLKITADNIQDLDKIVDLNNLEILELCIRELTALPENLGQLTKLESLIVSYTKLSRIQEGLTFPKLKRLNFTNNSSLQNIPESLFKSRILSFVNLYGNGAQNKVQLPSKLNLPYVKDFKIGGMKLVEMPELRAPELTSLNLSGTTINNISEKLKEIPAIEKLHLSGSNITGGEFSNLGCKQLKDYWGPIFSENGKMDFSSFKQLTSLNLSGENSQVKVDVSNNKELRDLTLTGNSALEEFILDHPDVENLKLVDCINLSEIKISTPADALKEIAIQNSPKYSEIKWNGNLLPKLRTLRFQKLNPDLTIAPELILASLLFGIYTDKDSESLFDELIKDKYLLFDVLRKKHFAEGEKVAVGYWFFKSYQNQSLTKELKLNSLKALRYSVDIVYQLIAQHFHRFNPNGLRLDEYTPDQLKGKKVSILGKTEDTKTSIKQGFKDFGMKYTSKPEEADAILFAKKADLKGDVKDDCIFFRELDWNSLVDQHQPKFLKSEETDADLIDNLKQLLWSTDPDTEAVALEMMKNGGLPDDVVPECIIVAKTCTDKALRAKYKSFLKGKISEIEQKLLSMNVRFDLSYCPLHQMLKYASEEFVGKMAVALYKRKGDFWSQVLKFNKVETELRKQIIEEKVKPELFSKPHYVQLRYKLNFEELGDFLDQEIFKGKLKRLHITSPVEKMPKSLAQHITLKELVIRDFRGKEFPREIFELKRLSDLTLDAHNLEELPEEITQLIQLKTINIHNKKPIKVKADLSVLPKLNRKYFSGGVLKNEKSLT
ncbi:leucine-rich repeat domain-containing protein [Chondrinema litorale]|uniref:leucine-rich repeat domain-containing protein n=1 Tax=Chondrinema litorale TaxID=2994555 RepID=UPI00254316A3|nr:hypothetical protein [Chondrinema litorale]UZR96889.1 hypothetical protein OQ292_24640 [Chondrinema litorale]